MSVRIDEALLHQVFWGGGGWAGVCEQLLGFPTTTTVIKGVHIANDLAQCILGGAPDHQGDLLCRVIREEHVEEENDDASLREDPRIGAAYQRAFSVDLGAQQTAQLRAAIGELVNFDGGLYQAGTSMASGLVTYRDLLGFEGFRRFRVGRYLQRLLGETGQEKVKMLFQSGADPMARALAPLWWDRPLVDKQPDKEASPPLSPFEEALGRRLTQLLSHPLTKPMLLRYLILGFSLGLVLKLLGSGKPDGCPTALATMPGEAKDRPLRQEAIQSFGHGMAALNRRLAELLLAHPLYAQLWSSPAAPKMPALEFDQKETDLATANALVKAAREHKWTMNTYWPEEFVVSLGRKAGCIQPKRDAAGWGKHTALTPELVEVLVLMFTEPGKPPVSWRKLWLMIGQELGLWVGVNEYQDLQALSAVGINRVDLDALAKNAELVLMAAVQAGVARQLPDSGAEAGGELS